MTGIRRTLVLFGLTVAAVIGTTPTAHATFSDSVAVSTGIGTATVAPVTNLVGELTCTSPATMSATWTRSTTPRVSGYAVEVHFSDGYVQTVELGPTATSWSASIETYSVTVDSVQYSVTTKTDYGWTAKTALTPAFQC
jgi:hypothetical protein